MDHRIENILERMSLEKLEYFSRKFQQEISRRKPKKNTQVINEWIKADKKRTVTYSFTKIGKDWLCTIVVSDGKKTRVFYAKGRYTDAPNGGVKKLAKENAAKMFVDIIYPKFLHFYFCELHHFGFVKKNGQKYGDEPSKNRCFHCKNPEDRFPIMYLGTISAVTGQGGKLAPNFSWLTNILNQYGWKSKYFLEGIYDENDRQIPISELPKAVVKAVNK